MHIFIGFGFLIASMISAIFLGYHSARFDIAPNSHLRVKVYSLLCIMIVCVVIGFYLLGAWNV